MGKRGRKDNIKDTTKLKVISMPLRYKSVWIGQCDIT